MTPQKFSIFKPPSLINILVAPLSKPSLIFGEKIKHNFAKHNPSLNPLVSIVHKKGKIDFDITA